MTVAIGTEGKENHEEEGGVVPSIEGVDIKALEKRNGRESGRRHKRDRQITLGEEHRWMASWEAYRWDDIM